MYTITFYSHKGGVGRSLALANAAYGLLREEPGLKIGLLDLAFESPGLDLLEPFTAKGNAPEGGMVDYIKAYSDVEVPDPTQLPALTPYSYSTLRMAGEDRVVVLPALGQQRADCHETLSQINWHGLYQYKQGYEFFQQLKQQIENEFSLDYLFIDVSPGFSDLGSVAINQLSDLVVLLFSLNRNHLKGTIQAYQSIISGRRIPPEILLVASLVPGSEMVDSTLLNMRLQEVTREMPRTLSNRQPEASLIQVPYQPRLAFDDTLCLREHQGHAGAQAYRQISLAILAANPGSVFFYLERAKRFEENLLFEEAEVEYVGLAQLHTDDQRVYHYHGEFLLRLGRWQEAEQQLRRAYRLDPRDYRLLQGIGHCLARLGQEEQSLMAMEEASRLAPNDHYLLHAVAKSHYKLGNKTDFLTYLEKSIEVVLPAVMWAEEGLVEGIAEVQQTLATRSAASFVGSTGQGPERIGALVLESDALSLPAKMKILQAILKDQLTGYLLNALVLVLRQLKATALAAD